ncbi:flagellar hook-associated protein FlgK [Syntrophotalea carbinolica DSM 2380]|uniref:Flagellar hook-associated protein 1 n=1 Tax=Syntrophotalea carbinolica (strain DSM 2380 / NBRC 103641 / GraBd1) TaxID=338963 RepID=Q3A5F9_SYNC1|nr:flagellar hook-associated protein FlgK [Syntrophotalea carbinolica]ABA88398.1 flagellar hook-associated protein FlgK [Syntrophotalea carbinolica DSM 2380]
MSGLTDALNLGKTSLATHQTLLDVTGNNIANVNTDGYSRQSVDLGTVPALNFRGFQIGRGVTANNIQRAEDTFLNRQILDKNSGLGEQSAQTTPLAEMETIFNLGNDNLTAKIDQFFDGWEQLSVTPDGSVERDTVLQYGTLLADSFHSMSQDLADLSSQVDEALTSKLAEINQKLAQVADYNQRITTLESTGINANADRDGRDALLEELSFSLGTQSYENNDGNVSVQLPTGLPLISGNRAFSLEATATATGSELQLNLGTTTRPVDANGLGGEFKGLLNLRDQFIPQVQDNLDRLAYTLSTEVNTLHAGGTGLDGSTGQDFFSLSISGGADPWSGAAAGIEVALTASNQVAAGQSSAVGDNTNALLMTELKNAKTMDGAHSFGTFYAKIASDIGLESAQNQLSVTGLEDTMLQLENLRDSKVGVSLEEEMINLIQYQRGFEASAKLLTTVDEMMDTVLSLKR